MSEGLNYHPSEQGVWIEYNGWRYKDVHHIKLHDGTVVKYMYPNGNSWNPDVTPKGSGVGERGEYKDSQVKEIMLCTDDELKGTFRGDCPDYRLQRNIEMFGDAVPAAPN
jgi:hypothetical protein